MLEGDGAYTAVEGERADDAPRRFHPDAVRDVSRSRQSRQRAGDVARRPGRADRQPVRHQLLGASRRTARSRSPAAKATRWRGMAPTCCRSNTKRAAGRRRCSPIPYARSREALDTLQRNGPIDPCHGVKMQYVNPATGGYPMPTIAAFLQLLPSGFRGKASRSTDSTIYSVAEGRGRSRIGTVACSRGRRATSSSRRRGRPSRTRRMTRPCCSVSRTAPRKKRWACGAKRSWQAPDIRRDSSRAMRDEYSAHVSLMLRSWGIGSANTKLGVAKRIACNTDDSVGASGRIGALEAVAGDAFCRLPLVTPPSSVARPDPQSASHAGTDWTALAGWRRRPVSSSPSQSLEKQRGGHLRGRPFPSRPAS